MKSLSLETTPLLGAAGTAAKASTTSPSSTSPSASSKSSSSLSLLVLSIILSFLCVLLLISSSLVSLPFESSNGNGLGTAEQSSESLSVYTNSLTGKFEVIRGRKDLQAVAVGNFQVNVESAGWNYLEVEATPQDDTMEKYLQSMRAMGYVEGFVTWKQIEQYYPNYYQGMFDTEDPEPVDPDIRVQQYLLANFEWMTEKSKLKSLESAHWLTVRGIVEQLEGLLEGFIDGREEDQQINGAYDDDTSIYQTDGSSTRTGTGGANEDNLNSNSDDHTHLTTLKHPTLLHFLILNGNGDLIQITEKIAALDEAVRQAEQNDGLRRQNQTTSSKHSKKRKLSTASVDPESVTPLSLMRSSRSGDHCSAFVKVLPDQSDVVFAHNTWDDYRNMGPRIFKHYIFPPWPVELKQEERKKDTLSFNEQPSHSHSHQDKKEEKKKSKKESDKKEKNKEDDKAKEDHCLCPATQYSKPLSSKSENSNGKRYNFAPHSYFSSSPGILTSVDDFYTTYTSPNLHIEENQNKNCYCEGPGGRLGIMETSLDVKSPELYDLIVPESLLSWIRVRSANLIAIDGNDWLSRFSHDHSGTYANQWMVIDFTKFHLEEDVESNERTDSGKKEKVEKKILDDGFLTIVEEMPGMIRSGDETKHLQSHGYWASYNEPFYSDLADYSGNTDYCQSTREDYAADHDSTNAYGLWPGEVNCYETCSRARLFQRLQSTVKDIHDAMSLITYNNYQHDLESFGDSCESISCREDLEDSLYNIRAFGAIDAKVSSILRSDIYRDLPTSMPSFGSPSSHVSVSSFHHIYPREPQFIIHQGPTTSNQQPFCWNSFESKQNNFYDTLRNTIQNTVQDIENQLSDSHGQDDDNRDRENQLRGLRSHDKNGERDNMKHSSKTERTKRNKRPSIQYNHYGQPNCFAYDWVIVPPAYPY